MTQSNQIQNNYFPDLSPEESQKISISQEIAEHNKKEISSPLQSDKNSIYHQKIEVELTEESEPNGYNMSKKKQKREINKITLNSKIEQILSENLDFTEMLD